MTERRNELGFYTSAGHSSSPGDRVWQAHEAERRGIGAPFISAGLGVASAPTNRSTRHPLMAATVATTVHRRACRAVGPEAAPAAAADPGRARG